MKRTRSTIIATLLITAAAIAGIGSFVHPKPAHAEGQCNILSMGFGQDAGFYGIPNDGAGTIPTNLPSDKVHTDNFIHKQINQPARPNDVARQKVTLKITSENCIGKELLIKIIGKDGELKQNDDSCCRVRGAMTPESNGTVYITYDAGEDNCDSTIGSQSSWASTLTPWSDVTTATAYDCIHGAEIDLGDGTKLTATDASTNFLYYQCVNNSAQFLGGNLVNRCEDNDKGWEIPDGGIVGFTEYNASGNLIQGNQTEFNKASPCYDATLNGGTGGYTPGCNALLAPLPGLTKVDSSVGLGQYINIIIRVAIGILTALAVVMLIVEGLQYMTTGSITGKYDARKKIVNIGIGLLIALGMFVLLSTINPNLLNLEPNISDVSIGEYAAVDDQGTVPTDSNWVCPEEAITLPAGSSQYGNKLLRPINAAINSTCKWRDGAPHPGIDISAVVGTDVHAAAGGTVAQVTTGCVSGNKGCGNGYGNNVRIDHGNVQTIYAHLSSVPAEIRTGVPVTQGQVIGKSGNTGFSEGPHLHFEVKVGGKKINPQPHLAN